MKPRRRKKGVLTSLGKLPKDSGKKKKKKESAGRKIFRWIGAIVLGGLLLGMIVLAGSRLFLSTIGVHQIEGEVVVQEITEDPAYFQGREGAVAAVLAEFAGAEAAIPLTAEELAVVGEGTKLRVQFSFNSVTRSVRVEEWEIAPEEEPEEGEGPDPEEATDTE